MASCFTYEAEIEIENRAGLCIASYSVKAEVERWSSHHKWTVNNVSVATIGEDVEYVELLAAPDRNSTDLRWLHETGLYALIAEIVETRQDAIDEAWASDGSPEYDYREAG